LKDGDENKEKEGVILLKIFLQAHLENFERWR
jgi:hypothetical protein